LCTVGKNVFSSKTNIFFSLLFISTNLDLVNYMLIEEPSFKRKVTTSTYNNQVTADED